MSDGGSGRWCIAPKHGSARGVEEVANELQARGLGPVRVLVTMRVAFFDAPDSVIPWLEKAMLPDCHLERLVPLSSREIGTPKSATRVRVGAVTPVPKDCKMGNG